MEADWSVEIGADLPRIVVPWNGSLDAPVGGGCRYVNLAGCADLAAVAAAIPEARSYPALAGGLLSLNAPGSPVISSKCDAWELDGGEIDPLEFDAAGPVESGLAGYIDLAFRDEAAFTSFEWHERWARLVIDCLRLLPRPSARVAIGLRQAIDFNIVGFGITLYVMGCGSDAVSAETAWALALPDAARAVVETATATPHAGTLQ